MNSFSHSHTYIFQIHYMTIYIIEQSPDNSCPLSTGGKFESFLPCKVGLIEAGTKGSIISSVGVSTIGFSFSFESSGSLLIHNGFVILILIRDGAAGIAAGVESNSTFPSIELFTAAYVVSTVAGSVIILSSGSICKIVPQSFKKFIILKYIYIYISIRLNQC